MNIGGIGFNNAFTASGARGWHGEGYPKHHHGVFKLIPGFNFSGSSMISKTTTIDSRMKQKGEKGNLLLDEQDYQPVERFPDCIKVYPLSGSVWNDVSLSGPGFQIQLARGEWQKLTDPFLLSWMAVRDDENGRLDEAREFVDILGPEIKNFKTQFGLEENISCPNAGLNPIKLARESGARLKITSKLNLPQGVKINVLTPIDSVERIIDGGHCDYLEIPNSLPRGARPDRVDWDNAFGLRPPPKKYTGGGWSCSENFEMAIEMIQKMRHRKINIPIICGAVSCKDDVYQAWEAGANAIAFARITTSPIYAWKINGIIKYANKLFDEVIYK